MFALSDSQPTSAGFISRVDPSYGDLLEAGFNTGKESNAVGYATRVFDDFLASDGNLASLARQELDRAPVDLLPVDELNKQYSLPGLSFDRPITDEMARLMNERHKRLMHYQYLTSELPTMLGGIPAPGSGFFKSATAFGANVAGSLSNPLDFALTFTPWFGEAKAATWLGRGVFAAEKLPFAARFPQAMPAIMNNLVSQTLIELPRAVGDIQETGTPDFKGIAADIVVGGAVAEGLRQAGKMISRMSQASYDAAIKKAIADAESGRPIDVSANVHQDPNIVRGDVEATLRTKTEAEIRQSPIFQEKVKTAVDSILKDRAFLEKRLEIVKKSETLTDEAATEAVRAKVMDEYAAVYASAEASVRVSGHVGQVSKNGARKLALDFLEFVDQLPPADKKVFQARYDRVLEALGPFSKNADITSLSANRVAEAMGLKYDWRLDLGLPDPSGKTDIPDMFTASPIRDVYSDYPAVSGGKAKVRSEGIIVDYAINEALRDRYLTDVLAREERTKALTQQELDRRIVEHAKALTQEYAKLAQDQALDLQRKLGSPELNTWLAEDNVLRDFKDSRPVVDARTSDPAEVKKLDHAVAPAPEDLASERDLTNEAIKELESLGDLTDEEKAFIEAVPDNEDEAFVQAIVDAASGCITGKAPSGK